MIGRGHPSPAVKYVVHIHVAGVGPRPRGTFESLSDARDFARTSSMGQSWRIDRTEIVERGSTR